MILNIITFIFSILGIIGFYNNNDILLYIGMVMVLFEMIIGILSGQLRTIGTYILASIIGVIFTQNIIKGIAIGLCFESVIMTIGGWLLLILGAIFLKNDKGDNKQLGDE